VKEKKKERGGEENEGKMMQDRQKIKTNLTILY
jgi:hypothetical protein